MDAQMNTMGPIQGPPAPKIERCIAKIGEPFHMRECGEPCEYLTADRAVDEGLSGYAGWRHIDRTLAEHHGAVPRSWL